MASKILRVCLTCKTDFQVWPCQVKKGSGNYCSHRCSMSGHSNHKWNGGEAAQKDGYITVFVPDHPLAQKNRVPRHRLVAEKALGRILELQHPVHHVNEIKGDDRNGNLVICEDHAYHMLIHRRTNIVHRGGDPDKQSWCARCRNVLALSDFTFKKTGRQKDQPLAYCKQCQSKYYFERKVVS